MSGRILKSHLSRKASLGGELAGKDVSRNRSLVVGQDRHELFAAGLLLRERLDVPLSIIHERQNYVPGWAF